MGVQNQEAGRLGRPVPRMYGLAVGSLFLRRVNATSMPADVIQDDRARAAGGVRGDRLLLVRALLLVGPRAQPVAELADHHGPQLLDVSSAGAACAEGRAAAGTPRSGVTIATRSGDLRGEEPEAGEPEAADAEDRDMGRIPSGGAVYVLKPRGYGHRTGWLDQPVGLQSPENE